MSTAAAPRPIAAIAFIVAGAAVLLALAVFAAAIAIDTQWLYLVAYVAMIVGLIQLARTELENGTAKVAALFAALGWVLLLVGSFVTLLPGLVSSTGSLVIFAASVVLAIVVVFTSQLRTRSRQALVAFMVVTALYMASAIFGLYGPLAALLTILFGIGAVLTGYFLYRRR